MTFFLLVTHPMETWSSKVFILLVAFLRLGVNLGVNSINLFVSRRVDINRIPVFAVWEVQYDARSRKSKGQKEVTVFCMCVCVDFITSNYFSVATEKFAYNQVPLGFVGRAFYCAHFHHNPIKK